MEACRLGNVHSATWHCREGAVWHLQGGRMPNQHVVRGKPVLQFQLPAARSSFRVHSCDRVFDVFN